MCGRQAVYLGRSYFFEFSRYLPECMLSVIFHCLEGASHFRTKAQGFPAYRYLMININRFDSFQHIQM